jgi:hypothetical protein
MIAYGSSAISVDLTGYIMEWRPVWKNGQTFTDGVLRTSGSHGSLIKFRSSWNHRELLDAYSRYAKVRTRGWLDDAGLLRLEPALDVDP